jgi:hypothetical protein
LNICLAPRSQAKLRIVGWLTRERGGSFHLGNGAELIYSVGGTK